MRVIVTLDLDSGWDASAESVSVALDQAAASFEATTAGRTISPRDEGTLYTLTGPIGTWAASQN